MPTKKAKETVLHLAISLAEVEGLLSEVADLKQRNVELEPKNEALKKRLHDLTDPVKKTDAAAFKAARRR